MSAVAVDRSCVDPADIVTTEHVAKVIEGIPIIGHARTALRAHGWAATVTAQRITVEPEIIVQYVSVNGHAWWSVYAADGTAPAWIVGARGESGNWSGAVE